MVSGNFEQRVKQAMRQGPELDLGNIAVVTEDDGVDIFDALNTRLAQVGKGGAVILESNQYTKANGKAVSTQLQSQAEEQNVIGFGANVELADGADVDMVSIKHDSFTIEDIKLFGNRNNNSLHTCIDSDSGLVDITVDRCKVAGAPHGIHLDGLDNSNLIASGSVVEGADVDISVHLSSVTDTTVSNFKTTGFTDTGFLLENSDAIQASSVSIAPETGAGANNGVNTKGVRASSIDATIRGQGELDKGLLDEAFDVGGADERFPTNNTFEMNVIGVNKIGFHLKDGEKETVDGKVDGGSVRTNQAWFVEDANDLANPQHSIDVDASDIDRITDTDETGSNVGLGIEGHYSKIQSSSVVGMGGSSVINIRYGQSTPSPTLETKSGTDVVHHVHTKKDNTDNNGQVNLDWSDHYAFGDKPLISVSIEQSGEWYVTSWNTNTNGRYTDADIQITDSGGTAVGNNVTVIARLTGV